MSLDLAAFNDAWLEAWSNKDVEGLLAFYADDVVYIDPQIPRGVRGKPALRAYLTELFATCPPMTYLADQVWPGRDGYFGRWYCELASQGRRLRGFDVVALREGLITFNEVYTHSIETAQEAESGAG